ncbi:hypothetical protein TREMEDRAFT_73216 [Tremella mesenterica DSM 1558]|uniref:uncharacterized protein n=1 Tax=Tremella mesenterica (strain ATCC 24925 / CBS 8224 / DSM 1558 / NBRC 9311 / NRRL Y-6157 / RJB 2259-6 / UBC 559-6) TaxID=578456 RepID=UPI0003F4A0AA|nr:uncharacterized protein TREMEDRAFT_73216 [Tremella mesenterica DSM 1558]EIW71190.1 hypothetical protein TREMEDRAFT_73216 [Tremella mesenterica DSM 1558]
MSNMQFLDNRLSSFSAIVKPKSRVKPAFPHSPDTHPNLTPLLLAEAGFYHTPGSSPASLDTVRCFLCACELGGWEKADDAFEEHVKRQGCAWADIVCQGKLDTARGRERDDYSTPQDLPSSAESAKVRQKTYEKGWPHKQRAGWIPTPKNLSKAGFVFYPSSDAQDCCLCPLCDLAIDGWEASDDPMEVHQRKSSECRFFTAVLHEQPDLPITNDQPQSQSQSQSQIKPSSQPQTRSVSQPRSQPLSQTSRRTRAPTISEPPESQSVIDEDTQSDAPKKGRKPRATSTKPRPARGRKKVEEQIEEVVEEEAIAAVTQLSQNVEPTNPKSKKGKQPKVRNTGISNDTESVEDGQENQIKSKSNRKKKPVVEVEIRRNSKEKPQSSNPIHEMEEQDEENTEETERKKVENIPIKSNKSTSNRTTSQSKPLSQLDRFINIPPASPMDRPVKTLKRLSTSRSTSSPDKSLSRGIPREALDKSSLQGAIEAREVVEKIASSPIPIGRIQDGSSGQQEIESEKNDQESGREVITEIKLDAVLTEEEKSMTVEQLVRAEMNRRYKVMEREGSDMISAWETRTSIARKRIESL